MQVALDKASVKWLNVNGGKNEPKHRFKYFMIGIYKIHFQILQTSAENGWHSDYSLPLSNIFPTAVSHVCFLSISLSFPPRLSKSSLFRLRHKIPQSFVMSVRRLVAVTPALLVGQQRWQHLFWGSRMRKACPGFPRPVKTPAEVLLPDPTALKDVAATSRLQVTGE